MTSISYIIPTRNRPDLLKKCLQSLLKVTRGEDEIIVVDDASNETSTSLLHDYGGRIKIIQLKKQSGAAAARNTGIINARGRYCIFLDDDTEIIDIDPHKLIDYADSNSSVGAIGLPLFYPDGRKQESARAFPTLPALLWRGTFLRHFFPNAPWYTRYINAKKIDWVISAGILSRRDTLTQIGMFNIKYDLVYEDTELCRRIQKAGYTIEYWHHGHIIHHYQRISAQSILSIPRLKHILSIARFLLSS